MATSTSKPQPNEQTQERKPRASTETRKTTKKPSTRSKSKAKSGRQSKSTLRETCGLAIVGAAVFMLFCVFSGSDFTLVMGTRRLLFGTTGILAYFIPIVVGWFGAAVIFSDKLGEGRRRGYVITTLSFLVLAFIHLFSISEIDTTSYGYFFAASYEAGQIPAGTGAIGALLSYPLYFLFDWWGSALILFVSMLICVVAITRLSIRGLGENIRDAGVKVGTKMKDAIVEQAREAKEIRETRRAREMYREDILEDSGEAEYPQENNETNKKRGGEAKPGEEANERGYESPFDVKRRDPFNEPLTKIKDATRSRPGFSAEAKHGGSRFEIYNVDGEEAYEPEIYEDISESLESAEAEGPDSEELERQSRIEKFGYDDRYIPGIPKTEPRKARRSAMATRLRPVVPDVADIADGIVRLPDYLEKLRQPEADNYEEIDELDGIEKIISDTSILMPGDEELGSADILDEYDIGELNLEPRLNPIIEMEEADVSEIEYIAQQDEPMDLIALDNEYVADLHDDKVLSLEPVYMFPPLSMLAPPNPIKLHHENEEANVRKLEETFSSFGINVRILNVTHGPAITRYEIQPAPGVKVSRIVSLSDDIALNMAAVGVRIEAPIPGRAAIGIEVPNDTISIVGIRDVLDSKEFRGSSSKLSCAIGMDISGNRIVGDLADMPHILIAGATGAGKSVCISSIITSLLYNAKPEEVRLIMIDPKVVELSIYNGIPHLLVPVVTEPKKAAGALNWAVTEMTDRYKRFAELGVRNIKGYNKAIAPGEATLPQIVVIIDELADLMLAAPGEVEEAIFRLAQLARAAGIHLVIATQRPSVNVITGVIKANIPSRIAFAVASQIDSRTILDVGGAEKLLGRGDMLFFPRGASKPLRVQGCWVSDNEVQEIVDFIKAQQVAAYDENVIEKLNEAAGETPPTEQSSGDQVDDLLKQAIEVAIESGQASISMLQRRLRIGYARAGRLIDEMTQRGIISPADGAKPREVLISREEFYRVYGGADEFLIP